jgi:agmatine deiminase
MVSVERARLPMISNPSPRDRGFSMPAEWMPHAGVWTAWPAGEALWAGELEPVRRDFEGFVRTLSRFEPVHLLVRDLDTEQDARRRLQGAAVAFHRVKYDDVWLRDSGPIMVKAADRVALLDWTFNGWGQKYDAAADDVVPQRIAGVLGTTAEPIDVVLEGGSIDVNGAGLLVTTRQCLLSPKRNPSLDEAALEDVLRQALGVDLILWLDEGLEGDHTDGHVDTITRFVDERTIVTATCDDPADVNSQTLGRNLERLRGFTDLQGRPFHIVELPLPERRVEFAGERLPLTYANFYIANGGVVVPVFGDPRDEQALAILRPLFPGREVVGCMARALITGGGAFHCVTQQQPAGTLVHS